MELVSYIPVQVAISTTGQERLKIANLILHNILPKKKKNCVLDVALTIVVSADFRGCHPSPP